MATTLTAIFEAQDRLSSVLSKTASQGTKATGILQNMGKIGSASLKGLTVVTGAISTALGFLGKSVISVGSEFETAFQGVVKTVDFSNAQTSVEEMRSSLIDLSTQVPITAAEFSNIASAAGQLGISTDAIAAFSETMANLGVATNLTSDEASTALAQFANVMQMAEFDAGGVSNYSRLGSTIVALGNNFATTERDIVNMAQNLASVGASTGMQEHQIMALATAMSSVGIEAAAGGTSMSTFASNLQLAVETGSKDLKKYAKVAGMSAKEFQTAFQDDAAGAIAAFIGGLNDVERNGGKSAVAVLDDLGIKETRMRNMLLSLANSGDLLNETLALSAQAWEENAALSAEAEAAYATFANQSVLVKNKLMALGIAVYDSLREPLMNALGVVSGYMDQLREAFDTGGFDGLIGAMGNVLGDAISRIVAFAPQIADAAVNIIIGAVDAITANMDSIADAAVQIGGILIGAIAKLAPKIGSALLKLMSSVSKALIRALPKLFLKVPAGLYEALGLDKNAVAQKIGEFGEHLNSAIDSLMAGDFAGAALNIGMSLGLDTSNGVKGMLQDAWTKIKATAAGIFTSARNSISVAWNWTVGKIQEIDWAAQWKSIQTSAATAWDSAAHAITVAWEWAVGVISSIDWAAQWTSIQTSAAAAWAVITRAITVAWDWTVGTLGTIDWAGLWATIQSAAATAWANASHAITVAWNWTIGTLGEIDWASLWTKIQTSASTAWANASHTITVAWDWTIGTLGDVDWASLYETFKTKVSELMQKIPQAINELAADAKAWIDGGQFAQIGETVISFLSTAITNKAGGGAANILNAISGMIQQINWEDAVAVLGSIGQFMLDAIVNGIMAIGNGAAQLMDAISGILGTLTAEGAIGSDGMSAIEGIGTQIMNAIVAGLNAVTTAGTQIMGAISSILSTIPWDEVGSSLAGFVEGLISQIATLIQSSDFSAFISNLGSAIGNAAGALITVGAQIVGVIAKALVDPQTYVVLFECAKSLISGLWDGLTNALSSLGESITAWFADIANGVVNWFAGTDFGGWLLGVLDVDISTYEPDIDVRPNYQIANTDPISADQQAILDEARAALQNGMSEMDAIEIYYVPNIGTGTSGEFVAAMDALMDEFFPEPVQFSVEPVLGGGGTASLTGGVGRRDVIEIPTTLEEPTVPEGFASVAVEGANVEIPTVVTEPTVPEGYGASATAALEQYYSNNGLEVTPEVSVADVATLSEGAVTSLTTAGNTAGTAFGNGIATSIQGTLESIGTAISSVVSAITTPLAAVNLTSTGAAIIATLALGIMGQTTAAYMAAVMIANAVKTGAGSVSLYSTGVDVMRGLNNGINSMRGTLLATANSIASAIKRKLQSALQVNSPSKFTTWIGQMLDTGLIKGMLGGMRKAVAAAGVVAMGVTNAFGGAALPAFDMSLPAYASGTRNAANTAIVGERGPEIVTGIGGATVYPADDTARMLEMYDRPVQISTEGFMYDRPDKGGETTRRIVIELDGHGTIEVTGMSREEAADVVMQQLKPTLIQILEDEIYEGGDDSYDY